MKNIIDTGKVLLTIQAFDNRTITEEMTKLWHELLEPYMLTDCLQAVKDHYTESRDWLMPVDVIGRVKKMRNDRIQAVGGVRLHENDELAQREPGEGVQFLPGWRDKMRFMGELIGNGKISPAQYKSYLDGDLNFGQLAQQAKELG